MGVGRIHLLCVGINKYPNYPSGQLNFCKNDAELIFNSYSSYACQTKKLIIDDEATKQNILIALSEISKNIREEDYIIFSFAGHGVSKNIVDANSKNNYICPSDFKFEHPEITGISLEELKEKLELAPEGSGYGIITACDSDEKAEESPELKQGVFTYYLIESLKSETKKELKFEEVKQTLTKKVQEKTQNRQNPQFKTDNDKFIIPVALNFKPDENSKEIKLNLETLPTLSSEK